jgi:hypothetical protein
MWFLAFVVTAVVLFCSLTILPIIRNYADARRVGLPIIIVPVDPLGIFWLLIGIHFLPLIRLLPGVLSRWTQCCEQGSGGYVDRSALHKRYGPVFIHVNPAFNEVVVADPVAADNVMSRRKDFIKHEKAYGKLLKPNSVTLFLINRSCSEYVWAQCGHCTYFQRLHI